MLRLEVALEQDWPPDQWRDVSVVVGVSGGADSVALLRALLALRLPGRGRLVAAHFHHGLRGAEADGDADFVRELCRHSSVTCEIGHASINSQTRPDSTGDRDSADTQVASEADASEASLRRLRLQFLREVAHQHGARFVALAHTADDQVETILHRLFRGTGLIGLQGMPRVRRLSPLTTLIRPLLSVDRRAVRAYLSELGQSFRDDSSNADVRYTRNRIRHELLPWLERHLNSQSRQAVLKLSRQVREEQQIVQELADQLSARAITAHGDNWVELDVDKLAAQPPALVRRLFVSIWAERNWPAGEMDFERWDALARFALHPATTRFCLPGPIEAEWTASGRLRVTRLSVP